MSWIPWPERYRIDLYEEPTASKFPNVARFVQLCAREKYGVANEYVAGKFAFREGERRGAFVILATRVNDGAVVGVVRGSMHTRLPGVRPERVMWIDLVCADPLLKGTGSILMHETEEYAKRLGARTIVLTSILDPHTMHSYYRKQFVRGIGERTPASVETARQLFRVVTKKGARDVWKTMDPSTPMMKEYLRDWKLHRADVLKHRKPKDPHMSLDFRQALADEFYPVYNSLLAGGSTIAMFKNIRQATSPGSAVSWNVSCDARFKAPAHGVLATYVRRRGRFSKEAGAWQALMQRWTRATQK